MWLDGIRIRNYRSFDASGEGIILENFGKVNLFVGKNNSGKSNILSFINNLTQALYPPPSSPFEFFGPNDHYDYKRENEIDFSIQYLKNSQLDLILNTIPKSYRELFNGAEQLLIDYKYDNKLKQYSFNSEKNASLKMIVNESELQQLILKEFHVSGGYLENLKMFVAKWNLPLDQNICIINTFRRIEGNRNGIDKNSDRYKAEIYNGFDLIDRLDSLKHPKAINRADKQKFEAINEFVKDILNKKDLEIEISNDDGYGKELSIILEGKQYPLENLGTGIHQLIILAATVTVLENYIICIEEPEIFMHPELQKKFIRYLFKTKNQYFIATHSNAFLNVPNVDIYHITHDGTKSSSVKVLSANEKNTILDDLGIQASDLLQTNFLLWVEGPSDRIYINYWLKGKDRNLIEGVHYSIMFYGGRLLSHLTSDDKALSDFIKLNKINRNIGIVIDSDKCSETDTINATKQRIISEFEKDNYFTWLTYGREIENYIEPKLDDYFKKLKLPKNVERNQGQYSKLTEYKVDSNKKEIDKIDLAKFVVSQPLSWDVNDLNDKIEMLLEKIKLANQQ